MRIPNRSWFAVAGLVVAACLAHGTAIADVAGSDTLRWDAPAAASDTLRFMKAEDDDQHIHLRPGHHAQQDEWLQAPFGDGLLTDLDRWHARGRPWRANDVIADYNRVDLLRIGLHAEYGPPGAFVPRVGGRIEYSDGRDAWLYGIEVQQPVVANGRLAVGVSFTRCTDHSELQQIEDFENTLAMLFGRQDYRDYWGREGAGAYLMWRVPDFSTVSVHLRQDDYTSLEVNHGVRSWIHMDRPLRDNPPIDDGRTRSATLRFERLLHRSRLTRAGLYHWVEIERAGSSLGGDFSYTRALADIRSVLRLSPATTLALRGLAGSALSGTLTRQKEFTLGGVDGLRAHSFAKFRGDQIALVQAEYTVGLWQLTGDVIEGGLSALLFIDSGKAWTNPDRRWDPQSQTMETDAGFGIGTSDDNMRLYFARNLQEPGSDFVVTLRLQRPF